MSENYIKIEIVNSVPYISMEYDSIQAFQHLIFCMLSEKGSELFIKTIESDLLQNNKTQELEVLAAFLDIIKSKNDENMMISQTDTPLLKPSSFK